jgi:hypothetical protein
MYGPTGRHLPLLDFTESFRIAAFFATLGADRLSAEEPSLGVIFYHSSSPETHFIPEKQVADGHLFMNLAGIRVGALRLIRPHISEGDDRIMALLYPASPVGFQNRVDELDRDRRQVLFPSGDDYFFG